MTEGTPIRLQKYLARAGLASRRKCEELITSGKVEVNGQLVLEPYYQLLLGVDEVRCEGELLRPAKAVYYKLYKPTRVLSAMGEADIPTLSDFIPPDMTRVFSVGRLDYDAEGLLLLTNDGDLSNLLLHPRYHVEKQYLVKLKPCPSRGKLQKLAAGVELDGRMTKPSRWELTDRGDGHQCLVEVTLTEGRKNQIKRMANLMGSEVRRLHRTKFGPILQGHMKPGQLKKLSPGEVAALQRLAEATRALLGQGSGDDDHDDEELD